MWVPALAVLAPQGVGDIGRLVLLAGTDGADDRDDRDVDPGAGERVVEHPAVDGLGAIDDAAHRALGIRSDGGGASGEEDRAAAPRAHPGAGRLTPRRPRRRR